MNIRRFSILFLLLLAALPARAHFLFLLPDTGEKNVGVRLVFSDELAPDANPALLEKIMHTKIFSCDEKGNFVPVKFIKGKEALELSTESKGGQLLFANCKYGVIQRGMSEPFLLNYTAKTVIGSFKNAAKSMASANKDIMLDVVFGDTPGTLKVLWQGKPLADAKVKPIEFAENPDLTTDKDGQFKMPNLKPKTALFAVRVVHNVKKPGELDGKKYNEERYYTTFVLDARYLSLKQGKQKESPTSAILDEKKERKEDPEASKLLADARAARANWEGFTGFTADIELNVEGKVSRGKLEVDHKGKVTLSGFDDKDVENYTRRQMSSIVGHRMDSSSDLKTPCVFTEDDVHHPLGRTIQVLNDEFHSSYRIRDKQVIVVNRSMKDLRFTITVLENHLNAEKQFLPAHYVVNSWDIKTNALKRSEAFQQRFVRVGKFDLPSLSMVVTASDGKLESRQLKLTNHKLK